ncbi:MAG: hypothetical protein JF597_00025 [Streptomyces sp.]|uniref:hypothetical protein n=1 Tax=Streptomyces sp. TaxID=1931 RepID=UPI0025F86CD0|nr:hypothetical protein [Streptomyces sp.]MBW8792036.1 hypothetical protein [Streptomyces sp.]
MSVTRWLIGSAGVVLIGWGALRLLTEIPDGDLVALAIWLAVAVAVHDGVLAPLTALAGAMINRFVPGRLRRFVSGALVAGVGITAISIPLLLRENTQPAAKALLRQNYAVHLAWLWVIIGGTAAGLYVVRIVRDARATRGR